MKKRELLSRIVRGNYKGIIIGWQGDEWESSEEIIDRRGVEGFIGLLSYRIEHDQLNLVAIQANELEND